MRHDRYGEVIDNDPPSYCSPGCRNGWIGGVKGDEMRPCLRCRPHLAEQLEERVRLQAELEALRARLPKAS